MSEDSTVKSWFPLTSYEFYAYLTSGMIVIAAGDYTFGGAALVARTSWTVPSAVFWAALAYLLGQAIAGPSSLLLEHFLARTVFPAPSLVQLRLRNLGWPLSWFVAISGGKREYSQFGDEIISSAVTKAGLVATSITAASAETMFEIAYPVARSSSDCASRLDSFMNTYGLCRNVSFALLISSILLVIRWRLPAPGKSGEFAVAAVIGFILLFGRFLKFYAAFSREVLRTCAKK